MNGPILPSEQSKKRSSPSASDKKASLASDESPVARENIGVSAGAGGSPPNPATQSGPILPTEQGVVSIATGPVDPPPPSTPQIASSKRKKAKASAEPESAAQTQIRFTVNLKVRLAKDVKLALNIVSASGRESGTLESATLEIYAKDQKNGKPIFSSEFPVKRGGLKIARIKEPIPLPPDQQKKLEPLVEKKTSASVVVVYTAPPSSDVTISLIDLKKQ